MSVEGNQAKNILDTIGQGYDNIYNQAAKIADKELLAKVKSLGDVIIVSSMDNTKKYNKPEIFNAEIYRNSRLNYHLAFMVAMSGKIINKSLDDEQEEC